MVIAPFTTQYTPTNTYPFEGEVLASTTALTQDSVADLSQIRVVDIDTRIQKQLGAVLSARMRQIDQAIKTSLGL